MHFELCLLSTISSRIKNIFKIHISIKKTYNIIYFFLSLYKKGIKIPSSTKADRENITYYLFNNIKKEKVF